MTTIPAFVFSLGFGLSPSALPAEVRADPVVAALGRQSLRVSALFPACRRFDEAELRRSETVESACQTLRQGLRAFAATRILEALDRIPSDGEVRSMAERILPSPARLQALARSMRERDDRLRQAVQLSTADPERDYEIWQEHLASEMPYEGWVSFRHAVRNGEWQSAPPPPELPDAASRSDAAICSFREIVEEDRFQTWILDEWQPRSREQGSDLPAARPTWTVETQTDFWTEWLARNPMKIKEHWHCGTVEPAQMIGPRVSLKEIEVSREYEDHR